MFDASSLSDNSQPPGQTRRQRERLRRRAGWGVSAIVHGIASAVVAAEVALALLLVVPLDVSQRHVELAAVNDPVSLEAAPLLSLPVDLSPDPTAAAVAEEQIALLAASQLTPELEQQLINPRDVASESLASQWVQARVAQEIAAVEKASREDQLQRLEQLTGTLNEVATEESVKQATARLAQLLNAKPRATVPAAEPPPGEFDLETAQLYDVKRADNDRGGFFYTAVLLDAEGRTLDSELTETEGEQLYRTFELMKANPLLARVYRGVVMSLLDKLLRPASSSRQP